MATGKSKISGMIASLDDASDPAFVVEMKIVQRQDGKVEFVNPDELFKEVGAERIFMMLSVLREKVSHFMLLEMMGAMEERLDDV